MILNSNYEVDPTLLKEQGLPYYAGTWVVYLIVTNLALAATFTHLLLWNREDLREAWSWMSVSDLRKQWREFKWNNVHWKFWNDDGMREQPKGNEDIDPHYAQMLKVSLEPSVIAMIDVEPSLFLVPRCSEQLVLRYFCSIVCGGFGGDL